MTANPFATNGTSPAEETQQSPEPAKVVAPAMTHDEPTTSKSPRKKPNKQAGIAQKQFVIANYATMSRSDIAEACDPPLTGQQVYNIIKSVRDAGNDRAKILRENGDEAGAAAIETKIATAFPKKMTGGKGGGRKKGTDVNALLDDLLG